MSSADLSFANLFGADLSGADLTFAVILDVNLTYADLSDVRLIGVYFDHFSVMDQLGNIPSLEYFDFNYINDLVLLEHFDRNSAGAILSQANLSHANLSSADLSNAFIANANLFRAILPDGRVGTRDNTLRPYANP